MRYIARVIVMTLLASPAAPARAQSAPPVRDLARATLEDLMNITITSAGRKEQRLGDVPASIYVITQDDIRRSGMTTLPELLRLAPGVQVAQINSNKWAVAVRGFNNLFADKVLVLVDGRTKSDRLNSGVFWESIDVPLDQIERIEVVRGPGGASWGANAVNGVISIVTKSAADTQGVAASVGVGTFDGTHAGIRYGGMLGPVAYRLSSAWAGRGQSRLDASTSANDPWESQTHLGRLDWANDADAVMMEGGATLASLRGLFHVLSGPVPAVKPLFQERSSTEEYDALGRWTHKRGNGSSLQVQSYFDFRHNHDSVNPRQTLIDVDAQYHTTLWRRHDVVTGVGYRHVDEKVTGSFSFSIAPVNVEEIVVNAFAQDEIQLGARLRLTLGAKVERDTHAGWGFQPTARVMWSVVPQRQQLWAAVSRARHTPSLGDISGRYNYTSFIGQGGVPVVVGALGNPNYLSEELVNAEAGYRVEIGSAASVDVTAFRGSYDKLKTSEPLAPRMELVPGPAHLFIPVQFGNLLQATTSGVEISARVAPFSWWRLEGGYSTFRLTPHVLPTSRDTVAASFDGNAPRAQWQLRSGFAIGPRVQLDALVFHTGALATMGVAAYTRADARLEVPLTRGVSVSVVGQNLVDPAHAEYAGKGAIVTPTLVPRSARVQLTWQYRR
jgi:iron complex outermembrane receptor protein